MNDILRHTREHNTSLLQGKFNKTVSQWFYINNVCIMCTNNITEVDDTTIE